MATPVQTAQMIRSALGDLAADNAHHSFEHLCRHVAKRRITSNVLPATGPVSAGGDQGRDFETFHTYLADELPFARGFLSLASADVVVFACTIQRDGLRAKFEDDIKSICTRGTHVDRIYIFATASVPTRLRHDLQAWAAQQYHVALEIIDGSALAEWLAEPALYWIAQRYLNLPAELVPQIEQAEHEVRAGSRAGREATGAVGARPDPGAARVRSAYVEQVRRIAPPNPPGLVGREEELAELGSFCLEDGRGAYVWWQAEAWAGKSALLSTFVLHPPPAVRERIRIVSFFITARLAAQDTRDAFTQVLLEQLAELTGRDLPTALPEATRDAFLLDLLAQAAAGCQREGGRLVLVVDGLDEDRGVMTGPDAHSIAGLLPADPPAGMRMIIAGRPNPPVPDDVPDWHPLRDPGIVRPLAASPYASDMQRLGRQELQRLLTGSQAGRDVLGLLTAGRGGLSSPDLAELTGVPLWEIEQILHTAAGRTFTRRVSQRVGASEIYLLGHESLQAAATRYLADLLVSYRDRLHAWADSYRQDGWPPDTPDYLLNGYYQLLASPRDLPRMIAYALDQVRHDRMLDITGGDTAALTEITTAQSAVLGEHEPDLVAMTRLAICRDRLTKRNVRIPVAMPAVWAMLGHFNRAEALARSIITDGRWDSDQVLIALASSVADAADSTGIRELADRIAELADSLTNPYGRAKVLHALVRALVAVGDTCRTRKTVDQLEGWVHREPNPLIQEDLQCILVKAVAEAGDFDRAETLARTICGEQWVSATTAVARALTHAGDFDRAEALACSLPGCRQKIQAMAALANAIAAIGNVARARELAREAEAQTRVLAGDDQQRAAPAVVSAVAAAGDLDHAEEIAFAVTDGFWLVRNLECLVPVVATTGDAARARQLADRIAAEAHARDFKYPWNQEEMLVLVIRLEAAAGDLDCIVTRTYSTPWKKMRLVAAVVEAVAASGDFDRAEDLAYILPDSHDQAEVLISMVKVTAVAGEHRRAVAVAERAEALGRALPTAEDQALTMVDLATAMASIGDSDDARALIDNAQLLADSIPESGSRSRVMHGVAKATANIGDFDKAEAIASMLPGDHQARAVAAVAEAVARSGDFDQAEDLVRTICGDEQSWALAAIISALVDAGRFDRAEALARTLPEDGYIRSWAVIPLVRTLARDGELNRAKAIAFTITDPCLLTEAVAELARAVGAAAGNTSQARDLISQAEILSHAVRGDGNGTAVAAVVKAFAGIGDLDRAEAAARMLPAEEDDDPYGSRAMATIAIAEAVARAGESDRAEELIRTLTESYQQAEAVTVLSGIVEPARARHLIAWMLCKGDWRSLLEALTRIEPAALREIATDILGHV